MPEDLLVQEGREMCCHRLLRRYTFSYELQWPQRHRQRDQSRVGH